MTVSSPGKTWPSKGHSLRKQRLAIALVAFAAVGVFATALPAAVGDLDATFGTGGKVTTDFGGSEMGWSVALQRDGKVVVAGERFDPPTARDFVLARYTSKGQLDPGFDGDGKLETDFGGRSDGASAVAIQPDGKVIAAGYGMPSVVRPHDFALARYNRDGRLDPTFGDGGRVLTTFQPASFEGAAAVVVQADGKIVAGGDTRTGARYDFALARYLPDGTLDASFDGDGRVVTAITGDNDTVFDLAVQRDGKIVAAGWTREGDGRADIALARYNQDGSLDPSFGGDGTVVASFAPFVAYGSDLALQQDGGILAAGAGLRRFNVDGSVDRGFSDGVRAALAGASLDAQSVVIQPDRKILVIGTSFHAGSNGDFGVARLTAAGLLDVSFGRNGTVVTDFSSGSAEQANDSLLQADGKLVVAGMTGPTANNGPWDFAVARYDAVRFCVVPNLRGRTLAAARAALTKAQCRVGRRKRAYSTKVKKGTVISQHPRAGTRVPQGTRVTLVVSRGRKA